LRWLAGNLGREGRGLQILKEAIKTVGPEPDASKYVIQCLKKLIKCFVLLHCFGYISITSTYYVINLGLFESPGSYLFKHVLYKVVA